MKKLILTFAIIPVFNSCSVYKAVNQPDKKDLSVLNIGTPRVDVIAELGKPIHTEGSLVNTTDIFSFKQGYGKANKTGRALLHGTADLFTAGLWEVIGTPAENIADGTDVKLEVGYDTRQKVKKVHPIKGGDLLNKQ